MKRFYLFSLVVFTTFSCTSDKLVNNNLDVPQASETESKGGVPLDHPLYDMMVNPKYTFADVDAYYRESIAGTDLHYTSSMKSLAFWSLMDRGLDKIGSNEQKMFYIEEILSLDFTFAFTEFYTLLNSCSDFLSKEELDDKALRFFEKTKKVMKEGSIQWKDEEHKNQAMEELVTEYQKFQLRKHNL